MLLRRLVVRPSVLRSSSVWRPTPARFFGDKASDIKTADAMEDKEANQVQLEQVSKQMEDAIVKEKQVHDTEQKAKNLDQTWDASSETVRKPDDPFMQQSKSQEMSEIRKEQERLTDNEQLGGFENTPLGRESNGSSQNMSASNVANTVVEKVKQTMSQTTENVQQIGKSVMGMSHDLAESAKHSMQNMREDVREGMKNVRGGMNLPENAKNYKKRQGLLTGLGEDVRHATQVTFEDMTEAAKKAMSGSPEARAARHEALAKEDMSEETTTEADDKNKPRSKRFSENKQNSSLL